MTRNKWQLHRAGFLNFWYYDDEEYYFADGKLLLRGSNGSGKSVTMQSLIPVLLDGKKSPDRLDPFGSKARRMEDYLLGEKDVVDRDERTGYLYLEYKREHSDQYLTTGIGLRAKRHSNIDFWGFVISDNRRIGRDFLLYKTEFSIEEGKDQKIPLSRRELENRIGQGGKVVTGQGEYMDLVNKHIFGFQSLDAYEELIKLLIQLRSPKLSKDFKPTVIYDILNESLPALSDDELRTLSDTIESMDQSQQQLDQLLHDQRSLSKLCKQYDHYNRYVLVEKAEELIQAEKRLTRVVAKGERLQEELVTKQQDQIVAKQQINELEREQAVLKEEEDRLKEHDVFKAEKEKLRVKEQLHDTNARLQQKGKVLDDKENQERSLRDQIRQTEDQQHALSIRLKEYIGDLDSEADETSFPNHALAADEFRRQYEVDYRFDLWKKESQDYQQKLDHVLKVLRQQSVAKQYYDEADRELGEAKKELDQIRYEEQKWTQLFEEEKARFLEAFHGWRNECIRLALSTEEVQLTARKIENYFEPYRSDQVSEQVRVAYQRQDQAIQKRLLDIEHKQNNKRKEIETKEVELQTWKARVEPEPNRRDETNEARSDLGAQGIPYLPFYQAVEFQEWVNDEVRARIEAAITQMGILDALIVPKHLTSIDVKSDRILRTNPQLLANTLADFLYPTPVEGVQISAEEIDEVLRSILIADQGEGTTTLREDGRYQIGLMVGMAPPESQSLYIGRESRKRYRLRQIAMIGSELVHLQSELQILVEQADHEKAMQAELLAEFQSFPPDEEIHAAYEVLKGCQNNTKIHSQNVERKNAVVKERLQQYNQIREAVRQAVDGIPLQPDEDTYQHAYDAMRRYTEMLSTMELTYKDYQQQRERGKLFREQQEHLILDIDQLKYEYLLFDDQCKKYEMQLQQIEATLQDLGADEIRARIAEVIQRLEAIPELHNKQLEIVTRLDEQIKATEQALIHHKAEVEWGTQFFSLSEQMYVEDEALHLISVEDDQVPSQTLLPVERAIKVRQLFSTVLSDVNVDREKVQDRLNKVYFQEVGFLVEYRLTQETILELSNLPEHMEDEHVQMQIDRIRSKSRRIHLVLEYEGKRVTPYYVLAQLEIDIERQRNVLNERDRELYEEIIMNNVGKVIRHRINRAKRWVEEINQLMNERDTSSGLTFSIRWHPRTADHDSELDTAQLVELLRTDPRLLTDEKMNSITQHFRSKITRAKEIVEGKRLGETLHQIIKEMLDYREWFAFTLYYRKEGEQRKEMTNNVFFKFSGGEKAMAMYIPLFSAAYSRYREANDDAPYIISLDEAFAGVDENNIRDMFELVEKLGFNYIMNSQALWGDYDTVSALSIYELVRPKNAPFVTLIRYNWNGNVRKLLSLEEESELYEGEKHIGSLHMD